MTIALDLRSNSIRGKQIFKGWKMFSSRCTARWTPSSKRGKKPRLKLKRHTRCRFKLRNGLKRA
jgi:hypothetical protein